MRAKPVSLIADLLSQAQAAYAQADYAQAARLGATLLADARLPPSQRVPVQMLRLASLYRQGLLAEVAAALPEALRHTPATAHTAERLELLRMGSLACGETGHYEDALRYAHEALALAGENKVQRVYALNAQASCFERMGDPWQAARLMEVALALAQSVPAGPVDANLSYARLLTQNNLCATQLGMFHILRDAGAPEEAQAVLASAQASAVAALPLARERGEAWPMVFVEGNLAEAQVHLGQAREALRTLSDALPRARAQGFTAQTWALRCTWAEACIALGRIDEALWELDAVMNEIGLQQPVAVLLRLHHALYKAHAAQGGVARALHHLEAYLALERERTSRQLQAQSRVLVTRIEMEQARQQAERARSEARKHRRRADHWADAAIHDVLTGLLNRRGLEERLGSLNAGPGPLAVVMVDVDHFKRVNDHYGHGVGDLVLVGLAQLLRSFVRPEDVLARFGGEEFTLLLVGLAREQALEVCERLRQGVQQQDWTHCGLVAGEVVTVSLGLSMVDRPAEGAATSELELARLLPPADEALYRAKRLGRNRVECA